MDGVVELDGLDGLDGCSAVCIFDCLLCTVILLLRETRREEHSEYVIDLPVLFYLDLTWLQIEIVVDRTEPSVIFCCLFRLRWCIACVRFDLRVHWQ
jgi:hypothetical protein